MILEPECIGCLFDQVYKAFNLLKPDISREKIIGAQMKVMELFMNSDILIKPGPLIGKEVYRIIADTLGEKDPYKKLKDKYNRLAMEYYEEIKEIVNNSDDPLFEAIAVSAIGNTIDFGAHHEIDVINDIKTFTPDHLKINDIPDFRKSLEKSNRILVLLDNAGEIVFDMILISLLKNLYPKLDIICAVRSAPIINDATMEDAKFVGLTEIVKVIEAPAAPGVELSLASEEFKNIFFKEGGIILSKGQGNFESLYKKEIPNAEVYYLLKAKCVLMQRIFKVDAGSLIFKKKTNDF